MAVISALDFQASVVVRGDNGGPEVVAPHHQLNEVEAAAQLGCAAIGLSGGRNTYTDNMIYQ